METSKRRRKIVAYVVALFIAALSISPPVSASSSATCLRNAPGLSRPILGHWKSYSLFSEFPEPAGQQASKLGPFGELVMISVLTEQSEQVVIGGPELQPEWCVDDVGLMLKGVEITALHRPIDLTMFPRDAARFEPTGTMLELVEAR